MIADHWPLYGLRLRTQRLELRLPDLDQLAQLAEQAAAGVHDPARMPFVTAWTDAPPPERARGTLQWHWKQLAAWSPTDWSLPLAVLTGGRVVGTQEISGRDFAVLREVATGSWLGRAHQGQGIGAEMRAAVLALAFTGLGAEHATTEAFADNLASQRVSEKLGYAGNGIERHVVRGKPVVGRRLRLDRDAWHAARTVEVEITGLEPCLEMFGLRNPENPGRT
jgi:RimJ/RimL family protein N-acetyltransferase